LKKSIGNTYFDDKFFISFIDKFIHQKIRR